MLQFIRQQSLLLILFIGLLARLFIAKFLPPGFDEAYYFLYTLNPAWSYFDHPPMVAGTTELGIALLGGDISALSIRLGSVLIYTLTLYLLYRVGQRLFSQRAGILAVVTASITPIFQVAFGCMTLPDAPLMLFWLASLYVATTEFFPAHNRPYQPTRRLAILGFLVGLACLSKYHGFILGAGYVGFCLTSKPHRKALFSPWTIASFGLFAMVLFPILYWNYQHNWASLAFQAERGIPARSFDFGRFGKALTTEMLLLFPTIGIPLVWVGVKQTIRQIWQVPFGKLKLKELSAEMQTDYRIRQQQRRLILWVSMPVLVGFTFVGGYRQIFPTWAMPGFFTATLLLAERASQLDWVWVKRWLIATGTIVQVLLLIALSHVVLGTFQQGSNYQIAGLMAPHPEADGSIELLDIEQLRSGFAAQPPLVQALEKSDFVFTNRFHLSGHIGMSLTSIARKPITCFDQRDMRGFAFWSTAEQWVGKTGLYLTTSRFQTREDSAASYRPYFQQFTQLGEIPLMRGGQEVERIYVFQGQRLQKPFPRPARATQGA